MEENVINFIITLSNLDINKTYHYRFKSEYMKKNQINDSKFTFENKILSDFSKLGMVKEVKLFHFFFKFIIIIYLLV